MRATAADSDGTVARVDFYVNGTLVRSDTKVPYFALWAPLAPDAYTLTAVAYDNAGVATTSQPVTIVVQGSSNNESPVVTLTNLTTTVYIAPATISLSATASDADGSLTRVDFYADQTLIGSDATSPYTTTWSNVGVASYYVTAVARDNAGATTVSAGQTITVTDPTTTVWEQPTTVMDPPLIRYLTFTPSVNDASAVERYVFQVYPSGVDPNTANALTEQDLGKPPVANGECAVDVSQTVATLAPGSYSVRVTAVGPGGSTPSETVLLLR
jgi:hypothetical protein